ncbi:DUF350 domain-containing protein [Marinobacter subterrani]|uniref:Putative membrane protein YjfL, UPF0719 family n=1 Tax=Marinobacter subterrani TaxID=1658765 RepID=A0A0J7JFG6_9GAMM|nr:DUF350 domain-containing protein [Marinobacter subterrani]KMQ76912.1 putative membrane protein YjfL, UPF0719 family [Marinobacter subterrani]
MEENLLHPSLSGLDDFALAFGTSLVLLLIFKWLYPLITPHREWQLVREKKNIAAAIALTGSIVGFSVALSGAATYSASYYDFLIWGAIALIAQILAYLIVWLVIPGLSTRIVNQETSAGILAGGTAVAVGLLNAACMSY